jgi:hypothetical protein
MKIPDPRKVIKNGALIFLSQAALPAENPIVRKFYLPIIISTGILMRPIKSPNLEKRKTYLFNYFQYPK